MNTLVKNGTVATASGVYAADVLIEGEKISMISSAIADGSVSADDVVDAAGMYILPGVIDPHTHISLQFENYGSEDDFVSGTEAAACGGVTCLIDFPNQKKGCTIKQCIDDQNLLAEGKASIDWSFHPTITDPRHEVFAEVEKAIWEYGTPSFKVLYVYDVKIDDAALLKLLEATRQFGGLAMLHAENVCMIDYLSSKFAAQGKLEPYYHAKSRPNLAEEEAVQRAIKMAEATGSRLYIVHLSSKEGLERIQEARNKGLALYAETCPQYLLLDESRYWEPDWNGAKYVMSPPLRTLESNDALWSGINSGDIQVVGTDHAPFNFNGKKDLFGKDDFRKIPNGAPGIETLLPLMHSEGVIKGKITLEKMVDILATRTARIFGLTQKGQICVGKDADIVIFNPNQPFTIAIDKLHMNVDYTPFEGFEVIGMPYMVFSRGKKVAQWKDGKMVYMGQRGWGRFVKRSPIEAI